MASAFDFLIANRPTALDWEVDAKGQGVATSTADKLARVVDHFRLMEGDVLVHDLSSADMLALGLHTVRVIVPDFQPIDFGWKERRLGGSRLYQLPYRLGLLPEPATPATLSGLPHPLA